MTHVGRSGREGVTLVEVLVAVVLVAVATMLWSSAFTGTLRRLDEAHLGLQAAIRLTEAARAREPMRVEGDVGPGRMTVRDEGGIEVRYEPPDADAQEPGSAAYRQPRSWTLDP
jgi:prepilin-type N-terminal cleavage/methylation domain-containing protein